MSRTLFYAALISAAAFAAPPARELAVVWPAPNPDAWKLLRQLDATAVITPLSVQKPASPGIVLIADLNSRSQFDEIKEDLALARKLGYDGAAVYAFGDEAAFRNFLRGYGDFIQFVYLDPPRLHWNVAPARAVLRAGLWPGLQAADTATAAATEKPWINANLHLYAWLRAHVPGRPAWLRTSEPNPDTRHDSVEVALAEAFAAGGHAVLQVPEMYRAGLVQGTPRARQSWDSLCALAAALRKAPSFADASSGSSTAIFADAFDEFEELINLPYRANLSPLVIPSGATPKLGGTRVLVVVNQDLSPEQARAAVDFIRAGGILVAAPNPIGEIPWIAAEKPRKVEDAKPWSLWELGAGLIYLYPEAIIDPSEFSFDLREISGLDNPRHTGLNGLDFRVWNAPSVLGVLYDTAAGGKQLVLISYGQARNRDFLVGIRGKWTSAVLRQPGASDQPLKLMPRGWFVEANLSATGRIAIVEIKGARP